MRFCSDSDRISYRFAIPFPDVRYGIAVRWANGINGKSRLAYFSFTTLVTW